MAIRPLYVIVADKIEKREDGKYDVTGLHPVAAVQNFPAKISIDVHALLLIGEQDVKAGNKVEMRLLTPQGAEYYKATINASFTPGPQTPTYMNTLAHLDFDVDKAGDWVIQFAHQGVKWPPTIYRVVQVGTAPVLPKRGDVAEQAYRKQ